MTPMLFAISGRLSIASIKSLVPFFSFPAHGAASASASCPQCADALEIPQVKRRQIEVVFERPKVIANTCPREPFFSRLPRRSEMTAAFD
jgi:hypothetical protein